MEQCTTLDADETIGCYCGDYSSCDNIILRPFLFETNVFPSHLFASIF